MPAKALLECSTTEPPANTLFPEINPTRVSYENMVAHLPLILRLFEISPEGFLPHAWNDHAGTFTFTLHGRVFFSNSSVA